MVTSKSGTNCCLFDIGIDQTGAYGRTTYFLQCTAFGRLGIHIVQHCKKGNHVIIAGRLQQHHLPPKKKSDKAEPYMELIVEKISFIGARPIPSMDTDEEEKQDEVDELLPF